MSDYGHAITTRQMIAAAVLLGDVSGPSFVGGRGAPGIEAGVGMAVGGRLTAQRG